MSDPTGSLRRTPNNPGAPPLHYAPSETAPDPQFVTALARGLEILACFQAHGPVLTNGELSRLTALSRSTVSRFTHTLLKLGFLEYSTDLRAYRLGLRVLTFQAAALAGLGSAYEHVATRVDDLARRLGETVVLAAYEDYEFVVVHGAVGPGVELAWPVGTHYQVRGTAAGRAYLGSCSDNERERIIVHLSTVELVETSSIRDEVESAATFLKCHGYCLALPSAAQPVQTNSAAVPVHLSKLGRRFILGYGAPASRVSAPQLEQHVVPALLECAREIEQACRNPA